MHLPVHPVCIFRGVGLSAKGPGPVRFCTELHTPSGRPDGACLLTTPSGWLLLYWTQTSTAIVLVVDHLQHVAFRNALALLRKPTAVSLLQA